MKLSEIKQKKNEYNEKIKQLLIKVIRNEAVVKEKLRELGSSLDRKAGCSFTLTKIKRKDGVLSKNYYLYTSLYRNNRTVTIYLGSTTATDEDRLKLLELSILFEQLERRIQIVSQNPSFAPTAKEAHSLEAR